MLQDLDHYEAYYAEKLWSLLPAVYRTQDSDGSDGAGPLRELVNRIGAQAAILRRSLDRLWDDQSIETCDDWLISYIGDLLGTNLVANLDARGRRIDVAKTIYYRRRKGTVALLEEMASDLTGWQAKVVELFRRLDRTAHGLDPEIGIAFDPDDPAATLQVAEGLVGPLTRTQRGGFANLRNVYGATKTDSAFDEFFHTPDFRRGRGQIGWHNIPRLGVFLWRLKSFGTAPTTPVRVSGATGNWFTFDPTGRDVPLFARASRTRDTFSQQWVSPAEAELPTPISQALLDSNQEGLTAFSNADIKDLPSFATKLQKTPDPVSAFVHGHLSNATAQQLTLYHGVASNPEPLLSQLVQDLNAIIRTQTLFTPQRFGSVSLRAETQGLLDLNPTGEDLARLNRLLLEDAYPVELRRDPTPASSGQRIRLYPDSLPVLLTFTSSDQVITLPRQELRLCPTCGRFELLLALPSSPPGEILVQYHYGFSSEIGAGPYDRRLGRTAPATPNPVLPAISGGGQTLTTNPLPSTGTVVIGDSLTYSGANDVVADGKLTLAAANEERPLIRLPLLPSGGPSEWILEGTKNETNCLVLDGLFVSGGDVVLSGDFDCVKITCCTLDPGSAANPHDAASPPPDFARAADGRELSPTRLWVEGIIGKLIVERSILGPIRTRSGGKVETLTVTDSILQGLRPGRLDSLVTSPAMSSPPDRSSTFPADAALGLSDGAVSLSRCTMLGRIFVHRLDASECILHDVAQVDDTQEGCLRFSAWADGSTLPKKYESVRIPPGAPLFKSVDFGQPGYAQLLESADALILPSGTADAALPNTIKEGAEDGSEMGAFARERNPIKERGLLIKFQEFMPAGLIPIIVHVT